MDLCLVEVGPFSKYSMLNPNGSVLMYARVSSEEQRENFSISVQFDKMNAWIKNNNLVMKGLGYDNGISAGNELSKRPSLHALIEWTKPNDIIVVADLSRLSRSNSKFNDLHRICEDKNVYLVAVDGSLDTRLYNDDPQNKFQTTINIAVAEYHRDISRKKSMDGVQKSKQLNGRLFGTNERFGYRWRLQKSEESLEKQKRGGLIEYEPEYKIIREIIKFAKEKKENGKKHTLEEIAAHANSLPDNPRTWYFQTIHILLKTEGVDRKEI
jgi:DNA invertase Pin-like site-specific DNA recombinase